MTTANLERYKKIQASKSFEEIDYNDKQYPNKFTMDDKKIVDSRYSGRIPLLTRKIIILFLCSLILLLMYAKINNDNKSYTVAFFTLFIFFLMMVPFFYTMKKIYYVILMYIIVVVTLGTLGYGWGFFGVLVNLNPLKKKKPTEKKNSVVNP